MEELEQQLKAATAAIRESIAWLSDPEHTPETLATAVEISLDRLRSALPGV